MARDRLPPTPKLRTPMKHKKDPAPAVPKSSLVMTFDNLTRNSRILNEGSEKQFLVFVRNAKEMRRKWQFCEAERKRLSAELNEKNKEIIAKDLKIKQARELVDSEKKKRTRLETNYEKLQQQWSALQEIVNSNAKGEESTTTSRGSLISIETLVNIQTQFSSSSLQTPKTPKKADYQKTPKKINIRGMEQEAQNDLTPMIEDSMQSLTNASELSYDDSKISVPNVSRLSTGTVLSNEDPDDDIIEKSTVSVSKRPGIMKRSLSSMITNAHQSAFNSQAISNFEDLQEKVKKLRKSREQFNTIEEKDEIDFNEAFSTPIQKHNFVRKLAVKDKCVDCQKKFKFGKSLLKCSDCGIICHIECECNIALPCTETANMVTPKINSEKCSTTPSSSAAAMTPERGRNFLKQKKQQLFQSPMKFSEKENLATTPKTNFENRSTPLHHALTPEIGRNFRRQKKPQLFQSPGI